MYSFQPEKTADFIYQFIQNIYNNLDSTKYSFITYHGLFQTNSNVAGSEFGSGVLPTTRFDNGLRLHPDQNGSSNFTGGNFSLYGIKEYS